MKSRIFTCLGCLVVLGMLGLTGCSDDDDPTTPPDNGISETIGSSGGVLEMTDEASMTVPADAVDGDVVFTMADAGSNHDDMVDVRALGSAVYSIGPSGTTFDEPVLLSLHYNEEDLGGVAESSILIYTDSGSGWTPLPTNVDEVNNIATAQIMHLSDFAVTTPVGEAADGVFALFEVYRWASYEGEHEDNHHVDMIVARFDGVVNMCSPVSPVFPDSVYCNTYPMSYDELFMGYVDENPPPADFLVLNSEYTFHVLASDDVPAYEGSIDMVEYEPVITNINDQALLSKQGFTVLWNDTSDGNVTLSLTLCDEAVVTKELPNNGSYTFTADDLLGLNPGLYALNLIHYNRVMLENVPGYDPASYMLTATHDLKLVNLAGDTGVIGPVGGMVALGEDGLLTIRAGALTETVEFEVEVNTSPDAGLEAYTLLTPVYTIEPSETTFAVAAELKMYYSPGDLGTASEEDIVILTNSGEGWEELNSNVGEFNDVYADLDHLSDFVAAVETPIVTDGVYAVLEVSRQFINTGGPITRSDMLWARFDAVVGDEPDTPLQAESLSYGAWPMIWEVDSYSYFDFVNHQFLSLGNSYDLVADGNTQVPDLDVSIEVMDIEPYITNLDMLENVPLSGFTLEWNGAMVGTNVELIFIGYGGTGMRMTVPNTGSYVFTEAALSEITPGQGSISLAWSVERPIVAAGFDSHSHAMISTVNLNHVVFTDEVVIENATYTSVCNLAIPDATPGSLGTPVTNTINVPVTGAVDSVRVYVDLEGDWSSDLTLRLTSPDGTQLRVFWIGEGGEPDTNPAGWYPDDFTPKDDLNGFDGEAVGGNWTITAQDMSFDQTLVLTEWRLQVFYAQ